MGGGRPFCALKKWPPFWPEQLHEAIKRWQNRFIHPERIASLIITQAIEKLHQTIAKRKKGRDGGHRPITFQDNSSDPPEGTVMKMQDGDMKLVTTLRLPLTSSRSILTMQLDSLNWRPPWKRLRMCPSFQINLVGYTCLFYTSTLLEINSSYLVM